MGSSSIKINQIHAVERVIPHKRACSRRSTRPPGLLESSASVHWIPVANSPSVVDPNSDLEAEGAAPFVPSAILPEPPAGRTSGLLGNSLTAFVRLMRAPAFGSACCLRRFGQHADSAVDRLAIRKHVGKVGLNRRQVCPSRRPAIVFASNAAFQLRKIIFLFAYHHRV
jgi:hypothetical protein